jgi:hypothetical protein
LAWPRLWGPSAANPPDSAKKVAVPKHRQV